LRTVLDSNAVSFATDYRVQRGDGTYVHVIDRSFIVRDASGNPIRMVGSLTDVSERKELESQLAYQAFHDALTGLTNRTVFRSRVEHALNQTERSGDRVAVLFIDLDRFKHVNDSLGHDAGDQLLVEVARRLMRCVRPSDTLSRRGGDEFTILLEDVDETEAVAVADRIRDALKAPIHLLDQDVFVTASVGIAIGAPGCSHADGLIRDADVAMYSAKVGGRAKHELFDGSSDPFTVEALKLEVDLRRAVERGEFIVHYQPMVDLATGNPIALEALVRWQHPERGIVSPVEFLGIAEETGLIVSIGRQVRATVCRQIGEWGTVYSGSEILPVYINCSPTEFQQPSLVADIAADLQTYGLGRDQLGIEITEHVAIVDLAAAGSTIDGLRQLGVRLALDDFGAGNAGLSHLLELQVDVLKLDKRFADGLNAPTSTGLLTHAIIELGTSLGMQVLSEGIETGEQAETLARLGSELGQGYYFARPMPPEDVRPCTTPDDRTRYASGHVAAG
jgi:diguanylate cyclase (GGDEF)-like protein